MTGGPDLLVVALHLLSNPSCCREVGASWTDVAVTLVAGSGGPVAKVAGLVALPLPLGEMRGVAQLGCDRGLYQHVPLRVQPVPDVGGVNVLHQYIHTYMTAILSIPDMCMLCVTRRKLQTPCACCRKSS